MSLRSALSVALPLLVMLATSAASQIDQFRDEITKRISELNRNTDLLIAASNLNLVINNVSSSADCMLPPSDPLGLTTLPRKGLHELRHRTLDRAIRCRELVLEIARRLKNSARKLEPLTSTDESLGRLGSEAANQIIAVRARAEQATSALNKAGDAVLLLITGTAAYYPERCSLGAADVDAADAWQHRVEEALQADNPYLVRRALAASSLLLERSRVIVAACASPAVETFAAEIARINETAVKSVRQRSFQDIVESACRRLENSEVWANLCLQPYASLQLEYALHVELSRLSGPGAPISPGVLP